MLENINLNDKDYSEVVERSTSMIPIISKEWTDFNNSDPGITVLQSLAVLKWVQQDYVNRINDKVRYNLLKLIGHTKKPILAPVATVAIKTPKDQKIKKSTKFYVEGSELVFEPRAEFFVVENQIKSVIAVSDAGNYDMTMLVTNDSTSNFAKAFNLDSFRQELYISLEKPLPPGEFVSFYFDITCEMVKESELSGIRLCDIVWEYYLPGGWKELCVQDKTCGLAGSGEVRVKAKQEMAELKTADLPPGFYIRARVTGGSFDVVPRIRRILLNTIELFGQDTKAEMQCVESTEAGQQVVTLDSETAKEGQLLVLCEEGEEFVSFVQSKPEQQKQTGRYYKLRKQNGKLELVFDNPEFGPGAKGPGAKIKVVMYDKSFSKASLGRVHGHDGQKISFDFEAVMEQDFALMLKLDGEEGRFIECKAISDSDSGVDFGFSLDYKNGKIVLCNNISCAGELIITSCRLCPGKAGGIKAGRRLLLSKQEQQEYGELVAQNIADVYNGKDREQVDDVLSRAVWDLETLHVAVTERDYAELMSRVPGLIVEKLKIVTMPKAAGIRIAVKIKSDRKMPKLTQRHIDILSCYIEKYRPIATKVSFMSPKYVPIDVLGSVVVKAGFEKIAGEIIFEELKRELDGVEGKAAFGKSVVYGEIYSKIEKLDCVKRVQRLEFRSSSEYAQKDANDNLILPEFALGYLNQFNIDTNNVVAVI